LRRQKRIGRRINRVKSKLPPKPISLEKGGKALHAKKMLAALKGKFNKKKQKLDTK